MMFVTSYPRLRLATKLEQYFEAGWSLFLETWKVENSSVQKAELALSKMTNSKYAIFTTMARVGIYLTIKCLIKPGQKVILSPYTISEVVNMVVCAGGIPVFCDLDKNTCNISFEKLRKALKKEKNIGAVMITHFYGLACEVEKISKLCKKYKIPLVEDTAQAFGAKASGRLVGTFGVAGILSFGIYKNINSFYGGVILTNNKLLASKIKKEIKNSEPLKKSFFIKKIISALIIDLATHPILFMVFTFNIYRFAYFYNATKILNYFKTDLSPKQFSIIPEEYKFKPLQCQAKILVKQLKSLKKRTEIRQAKAKIYFHGLKNLKNIILPPQHEPERHSFWYFPIIYKRKKELEKFCLKNGRDITSSYHRNCADLPCFSEYKKSCPNAKKTSEGVLYLPVYPEYPNKEIEKNIVCVKSFFKQKIKF